MIACLRCSAVLYPPTSMSELYKHPEEYDLEHLGDSEDVEFYVSLVQRLRPLKVLELGCGTGRITLPLAEQAARLGFEVVGRGQPGRNARDRRESTASGSARSP